MLAFPTFAALATVLLGRVLAESTLTPPVLPLIVRNPYLSTWLGNARDDPWSKWPIFYTGEEVIERRETKMFFTKIYHAMNLCADFITIQIGLSVLASVPDSKTVYPLLGRPHDSLAKSERDGDVE